MKRIIAIKTYLHPNPNISVTTTDVKSFSPDTTLKEVIEWSNKNGAKKIEIIEDESED